MTLVGRDKLTEFTGKHADARGWINNWIADVEASSWKSPADVKARYSTASLLENNVIIFNVKGNRYRLEVQAAYKSEMVLVRWVGTHPEYTKRYG